MNFSQSLRHFPTETRATGSPTTATRDCARVMAVFNNLDEDKNLEVKKFDEDEDIKVCSHSGKEEFSPKIIETICKLCFKNVNCFNTWLQITRSPRSSCHSRQS